MQQHCTVNIVVHTSTTIAVLSHYKIIYHHYTYGPTCVVLLLAPTLAVFASAEIFRACTAIVNPVSPASQCDEASPLEMLLLFNAPCPGSPLKH